MALRPDRSLRLVAASRCPGSLTPHHARTAILLRGCSQTLLTGGSAPLSGTLTQNKKKSAAVVRARACGYYSSKTWREVHTYRRPTRTRPNYQPGILTCPG